MKRLSQVLTGILVFATGSLADAPENTNSYEFLGIKYGQAPTGELRFASPKRYLAPEGTVFEASNWVNPSTL
jgi:carboxylesterase type B